MKIFQKSFFSISSPVGWSSFRSFCHQSETGQTAAALALSPNEHHRSNCFMIVDLSAILHRYSAAQLNPLIETSPLDVFITGLIHGKRKYGNLPKYVAVVLDHATNGEYRKEFYPSYKSNRIEVKHIDILIKEKQRIIDFIVQAKMPLVMAPRYEADDAIATLCHRFAPSSTQDCSINPSESPYSPAYVSMIGVDKDLIPLLSLRNTVMMRPSENFSPYSSLHVFDRYNVSAEQFTEYLALAGDFSDGYKGVPGIGSKTAPLIIKSCDIETLLRTGNVEEAMKAKLGVLTSQVTPKWKKKIEDNIDQFRLCYKLALLKHDVPGCEPWIGSLPPYYNWPINSTGSQSFEANHEGRDQESDEKLRKEKRAFVSWDKASLRSYKSLDIEEFQWLQEESEWLQFEKLLKEFGVISSVRHAWDKVYQQANIKLGTLFMARDPSSLHIPEE